MKEFGNLSSVAYLLVLLITRGVFAFGPIHNLTNNETGIKFMVLHKADDADTVTEARVKCRTVHILADVAEITNASDEAIVKRLVAIADSESGSHWLGISDALTEGTFLSVRTGQPLNYSIWKNDQEPIDGGKNCASRTLGNGEWSDESCTSGRGVLCSLPDPIPPVNEDPSYTDCLPTALPYNKSCYYFHPRADTMNFAEVMNECQGGMVIPYSLSDVKFLQLNGQLSGISKIWLGIWDKGYGSGNYNSVYGPGGATPYLNWAGDEPKTDAGHVNCVFMETQSSLFIAKSCTDSLGIVCKDPQGIVHGGAHIEWSSETYSLFPTIPAWSNHPLEDVKIAALG